MTPRKLVVTVQIVPKRFGRLKCEIIDGEHILWDLFEIAPENAERWPEIVANGLKDFLERWPEYECGFFPRI